MAGVVVCREAIASSAEPLPPIRDLVFWFVLTLAAEIFWLETPTRRGMVSMSMAVNIATLFLLPARFVLALGAAAVLAADLLLHRRGWLKAAFNGAQTAVTLFACLLVVHLLDGTGQTEGARAFVRDPLLLIAVPATYFAVNTSLVAAAISLHDGLPYRRAWESNYGHYYQVLSSVVLSLLGVLLVMAQERIGFLGGLLSLVFFFFIRDAYGRYVQNRRAAAEAGVWSESRRDASAGLGP